MIHNVPCTNGISITTWGTTSFPSRCRLVELVSLCWSHLTFHITLIVSTVLIGKSIGCSQLWDLPIWHQHLWYWTPWSLVTVYIHTYINTHFTYPKTPLNSRNSKNPKLKEHYKIYCKLLSKVIKEAKILQYKTQILTSYNKKRLHVVLLNLKQGKKRGKEEISLLNINGRLIWNQQTNANYFNDCFFTVAEKWTGANHINKLSQQKTECLYITSFKIVGIPIPILNSSTHLLKR